jgi:LmbE family N-acetylglucosaminyl deacetylase
MEPEAAAAREPSARLLTGRVVEWQELLDRLSERHGLTVIVSDPWSGTSALLEAAIRAVDTPAVLVDARRCADALDLAMAVADGAVGALARDANAWWLGIAPPSSTEGLRLWRMLSQQGVDLDGLRLGHGHGDQRLREAVELLVALGVESPTLVIDHLGRMLATMRRREAREILDVLRSLRQRHNELDLILIDHPGGAIATALYDHDHPLYLAGRALHFRRPTPQRVVGDLAITRPTTDVSIDLLRVATELAGGVPELTWKTVDLAPRAGRDDASRALAGWNALRDASEGTVRREWDLLRRVHGSAQSVVAALSLGLKPHTGPAASKSINDALNRLRDVGLAWQPEERTWALADPLLAAWARRNAPPWMARRSGHARVVESRRGRD